MSECALWEVLLLYAECKDIEEVEECEKEKAKGKCSSEEDNDPKSMMEKCTKTCGYCGL